PTRPAAPSQTYRVNDDLRRGRASLTELQPEHPPRAPTEEDSMPRTPLLRAVARFAREHRLAHELGTEPEAIRIRRHAAVSSGAATLTRRQLLQSIAVAGAGVALGATLPTHRAAAAQAPRIVIVGGGIAGLTAALTLWDAGVPATIYEASGRLGGRMFSATR